MGERMGGEHGCAVAKLQVSEVSSGQQGPEVMFEFMPLPVPPVGFEPTLTAPEGVAVYPSDLALRAESAVLGRVWVEGNGGTRGQSALRVQVSAS